MKERPINFRARMVRAILDGRKTQTRRIVMPQPSNGWKLICPGLCDQKPVLGEITSKHPKRGKFGVFTVKQHDGFTERDLIVCPYGQPGDRLWVRESLTLWPGSLEYKADGNPVPMTTTSHEQWSWFESYKNATCPSIHMPRWASRILLEITDVRVERLQDISEEDAASEGAPCEIGRLEAAILGTQASYRKGFIRLWESDHGEGSWIENPWVWVIEFKRINQQTEGE